MTQFKILPALAGLLLTTSVSLAETAPKSLDPAELGVATYNITQGKFPIAAGTLRIVGERRWDGHFLGVERIVFEPGAKLIFTPKSLSHGGDLYILTKEITSSDQNNPGSIIWEALPLGVPPEKGSAQAPGGYPGDDHAGVSGANGAPGNEGYRGADAPRLTLVAEKTSGPVYVQLGGTVGGQGGKGQNGSRGGVGGNGHPASQNAFNCMRGAGDGGAGGQGGVGGAGGRGGGGGNGGAYTLITTANNVPLATAAFRVDISPGLGGLGGDGGDPGPGGSGGQGGQEARPWCVGNGSPGPAGPAGSGGSTGQRGIAGAPGNYLVGALTPADVDKVLGF